MKILDRSFLNVSTPTCHAGTIAFYKGKPVFSWFGGSIEGSADSAIYVQYDNNVIVLGNKDNVPRWNPVLFSNDNKLSLFIKAGLYCDRWQTFVLDLSSIFDEDFSIAKISTNIIPSGLNGPVKTKPIFKNGYIYCGSSVETIYDWTAYIESYTYKDKFIFASRSNPIAVDKKAYIDKYGIKRFTLGIIQPSLWIDEESNINAFFRSSRGLGYIYHSKSCDDDHNSWSVPLPVSSLKNPNSGIDVVHFRDRLFLVHNPSQENRYPLVISEIDNENFNVIDTLVITEKIDESENVFGPELSYPFMIENDGNLNLIYTYGRVKMEQVVIGV